MGAEGHFPGRFPHVQADPRLEPLPVPIHPADQGDRCLANGGGQRGDGDEYRLLGRVQDEQLLQRGEPCCLILGNGRNR